MSGREADGHSSAALPWPDGCRILMIVGATGSGKTRLLRSLAGCAASLRSRLGRSGRSILDGLGADGANVTTLQAYRAPPTFAIDA